MKDPRIEKWLLEWGVKFHYQEDLPLDRVDMEESLHNQARMGAPINREVVERYRLGLDAGDVFPAPVYWARTGRRFVVVDGNHRTQAKLDLSHEVTDAYVIDVRTKATVIVTMTMEANVAHGLPIDEETALHHAMFMIGNGLTLEEAAHRLKLPKRVVARAKSIVDSNARAADAGVDLRTWDQLAPTQQQRLARITTGEGMAAATKLAVDARLTVEEIGELVAQCNASNSARKQTSAVAAMRDGFSERITDIKAGAQGPGQRGKPTNPPRRRWAMVLGAIVTLPAVRSAVVSMSSEELAEFTGRLEDGIKLLSEALEEARS